MDIKIHYLIDGAKEAEGLAVIIDVFRAFSTACYIIGNGAERIIAIGDINKAYKLKEENPEIVLIGERMGKIPTEFDYGNSPSQIEKERFDGKTVILTTTAGTQGIVNAKNAEEIITGSFVNADAVAEYVKEKDPRHVSLVAMGSAGRYTNDEKVSYEEDEDILCAKYIKNALKGKPNDFENVFKSLKAGSGQRFFDPSIDWSPEKDFHRCMDINRFDFVLIVTKFNQKSAILVKRTV